MDRSLTLCVYLFDLGLIRQFSRVALRQPVWVQSCGYKTKTIGLFGNEIKECEVEVPFKPVDSYLNPSTQEKIYPTSSDEYENIPVVIDGKEYIVDCLNLPFPPPIIPTIVTPDDPAYKNDEEIIPDNPGDTMADYILTHFAENMPTKDDENNPERDLVNYPNRNKRVIAPYEWKLYIFPKHWFDALYEKTGVTGPYVALGTVSMFLLSKEYLVVDHSVPPGLIFYLILAMGIKKYGPAVKNHLLAIDIVSFSIKLQNFL